MQQGKGKVKVKTKLMLKIGIHHTFFVRKLKELEEKVSSDQRGNTWQNTKGNEFSVPKKYVLKKKKNYRSNIVFREIWGEEHNTSYLQSCLRKSYIVYPRFRLHLTKASHILFVLKISQNMPADTE